MRKKQIQYKKKDHWNTIRNNTFLIGFLSILWFIARTGRKPSRVVYPCQQAASLNGNLWIITYIMPFFSELHVPSLRIFENKRKLGIIAIGLITIGSSAYWYYGRNGIITVESATLENGLTLTGLNAVESPSSNIFTVTRTTGSDGGVDTLIRLMGSEGLKLYQSSVNGATKGPEGLISADDVIIIKVNCQWDERGGTNTDLLKSLIQALIDHPDGFTGEVIISDNGQGEERGSLGLGGSFSYANNNAEDISQSVQDVVDSFVRTRVSTYLWSDITEVMVYEFSEGDMEDGYVVEVDSIHETTGLTVSYPKFTTDYGTHVSFKHGIWDDGYDSDKLKVINLSMLKSHSVYGATASVKNYMGVPSDLLTGEITSQYLNTHYTIARGGMGTLMVNTRFPVLNIIDAIWINAVPKSGPWTPYRSGTQMNIITASTDPVALDYWAVKYILLQNWVKRSGRVAVSMDPDYVDSNNPNFFGNWLRLSMAELQFGGYDVVIEESQMNVFIADHLDNQ